MTILEIVLLVIGVLAFVAGFFIPEKTKTQTSWEEKKEARRIQELIEKELDKRKEDFNDSLEEQVNDFVEKTERTLERISNEKIMAVNEYSDTVLSDINKNHEEAVFLYSMLNEKHDDIIKSQAEIESTSREVKNTLKAIEEAKENAALEAKALIEENSNRQEEVIPIKIVTEDEFNELSNSVEKLDEKEIEEATVKTASKPKKRIRRKPESVEVSMHGSNHNDEILRLYKEGKSNVAIAKELGLGVGEVKLVIDLAKM